MRSRRVGWGGARRVCASPSAVTIGWRAPAASCVGGSLHAVGSLAGATGVRGGRVNRRGRPGRVCPNIGWLERACWRSSAPVSAGGRLRRLLVMRSLPIWATIRMETIVLRLMTGVVTLTGRVAVGKLGGVGRGRTAGEWTIPSHLSRHEVVSGAGAACPTTLTRVW